MKDKGVANEIGHVNTIYRDGLTAYFAGDRETAIAKFDQVLDESPSHELAQEFRAKAVKLPKSDGGLSVAVLVGLIVGAALVLAVLALIAAYVLRRRKRSLAPSDAVVAPPGAPPVPGSAAERIAEPPAGPASPDGFVLVLTSGPLSGRRIPVGAEELVFGRADDADFTIPDSEVSRHHAVVRRVEGRLEVEDLGSANGTFVDNARISGVSPLRHGDVMRVGTTSIDVLLPSAERDQSTQTHTSPDATVVHGRSTMTETAPALEPMTLVVVDGPQAGTRVAVKRGELVLGRSEEADFPINDTELSRSHAVVRYVDGRTEIEDLSSTNGTYVNEERTVGPANLVDGDLIRIGTTTIKIVGPPGAPLDSTVPS
jgi:pSer/pThr/pTyr-binding forkhead associated (FHA) protein